jgi:hypothetical protein
LLLPKKASVPAIENNSLLDIAVRILSHSLTLALLEKVAVPLAAPSANPFGYISPTSVLTPLMTEMQTSITLKTIKISFKLSPTKCKKPPTRSVEGFLNWMRGKFTCLSKQMIV